MLVAACRAVRTPRPRRLPAAPDALPATGSVAMLLRGRMRTPRAIARPPAELAPRLIPAMLMLLRRRMNAPRAKARRPAILTCRSHPLPPVISREAPRDPFLAPLYHNHGTSVAHFLKRPIPPQQEPNAKRKARMIPRPSLPFADPMNQASFLRRRPSNAAPIKSSNPLVGSGTSSVVHVPPVQELAPENSAPISEAERI